MGIAELLGFDSARQRSRPAWSDTPNTNPPLGTVGPNVADPGDVPADLTHAQAWDGWPAEWSTPYLEQGRDDWSGFGYGRHDPSGYLGRVSTVMTCVDRNSSQLASFPIYGVDGLATERLPQWAKNPMPGLYSDWSDFALEVANSMMLDGEAIIWATERYADQYPARFMVLPARDVEVDVDVDRGGVTYTYDGEPIRRTADICHIRYQKLAGGFRGISPLQWTWRNLVSASILERYATTIAVNGPEAVLTHPSNLNAGQRRDAKTNWVIARHEIEGAPRVVSGGWDVQFPTLSPTDMALLDLRVLDDQRIAAAFRIQPYLVGVEQPGSMTYDNAQLVGDHHWRIGLRPIAKKIATAISAWAMPSEHRLEFDRDEYVNPGFGERASAYATMHGITNEAGEHAMTIDEIRIRERFDPKHPDNLPGPDASLIGDNP